MKRCIFAGPSLHGVAHRPPQIQFHPPAVRGELIGAVESGVKWIGLIDGYFGTCASVWHKEILYALSKGCHLWGAASMGALRAAECLQFGMRPVGPIAWQFATGELQDDAEVAVLHGPTETDYLPLTEAMVDVRATVAAMLAAASISWTETDRLLAAAKLLHFGDRTVESIVNLAVEGWERRSQVAASYEAHRVRAKQADALLLVEAMCSEEPAPVDAPGWTLAWSPSLLSLAKERQFEGSARQ